MGLLVDGVWKDRWYDTKKSGGKFVRQESRFRNWLTADGSPGPDGQKGFPAEKNRYHLYVSLACPWAHRTLIFRALKGLGDIVGVSVVSPEMLDQGWTFQPYEGSTGDHLYNVAYLHQIYTKADPHYSGRVTVPVLWDKKNQTIVSNESSEIIRMFNNAFDALGATPGDYYPQNLREEIDKINQQVYHDVNNGVYKAGFATTQQAYAQAVQQLFARLDSLEKRLGNSRYLVGATITEADWRLFTTLIRFDAVYVGHFKCNLARIVEFPNLYGYLRELYQIPGIAETVHLSQIKHHYYFSHQTINPTRVVPMGPVLNLTAPHGRG